MREAKAHSPTFIALTTVFRAHSSSKFPAPSAVPPGLLLEWHSGGLQRKMKSYRGEEPDAFRAILSSNNNYSDTPLIGYAVERAVVTGIDLLARLHFLLHSVLQNSHLKALFG